MAATATPDFVPWPDDEARRYIEAGCWQGRPLGNLAWECADQHPQRTAIVDGPCRITYSRLAVAADAVAECLLDLGLDQGDSVLTQLPNSWEHVAFLLGCLRAGIAPIEALLPHREHELAGLTGLAGARAVATVDQRHGFSHQNLAGRLAQGCAPPAHVLVYGDRPAAGAIDMRELVRSVPDDRGQRRKRLDQRAPASRDIALFLLSGGSTGVPKLIARTHDDYRYFVRQAARACGFGPDTVYLAVLPMAHNFALGCPGVLGTLASGGRVVMTPSPQPARAFGLIAHEHVTAAALVPAVLLRWLDAATAAPEDLSSLRLLQVGGSVMPDAVPKQVKTRLGATLQQVFGMAEGLVACTRPDDPDDVITTTQGRPISAYDQLRVVDQAGRPVPAGVAGELLTRGPYTIRGYYAAPAHNARSFTEDGWYRTGDLVRMDSSGNLTVAGRVKDVINRGGEKIAADDVECLVRTLPWVKDVCAVGVPDAELGERVCICVIPEQGDRRPDLGEIRRIFTDRGVAAFKVPERLLVFGSFPVTAVGKIDKRALRAQAAAASNKPARKG